MTPEEQFSLVCEANSDIEFKPSEIPAQSEIAFREKVLAILKESEAVGGTKKGGQVAKRPKTA